MEPKQALPTLTPDETKAVKHLLSLYRQGWFPMHETWEDGKTETRWVQPQSRGIIPLDADRFHVPGTLRSRVKSGAFEITTDQAFARVIEECGTPAPGREGTWLHDEIIEAFLLLHDAGHAHSIEAWKSVKGERMLVGGLYGLALGRIFCGESMFSRPLLGGTDASKVCLVHLVHHLRQREFVLLDSQLTNEHLAQFGCYEMARADYLAILAEHCSRDVAWLPFEPEQTRQALASAVR